MKHVVGLDIGSHSIKAVVAEVKKGNKLSLIQTIKMPSAGLRRGVIDDLPEATRAVNQVFSEIKKISKNAVRNIFLSASSPDFKVQGSRGIVAVARADSEIHQDDIDRAVEASQALKLPLNRMIVHLVVKEFIVDDMVDVRDPLGMIGNRLEVNSLVIDALTPHVKNLSKCVESAGGEISGIFFSPLAASRAVLSKNQKELGVALLDIGFGKTSLSIYEENKLLHAAVFPVGSGNVTNDLAIGLKTAINAAESIKLSLGTALAKEAPTREQVELVKFDPAAKGTVSRRYLAEIIEVRLAEILEFVNNELKHIGKSSRLPAGVVLVGGGSKLPGMVDLAKQELRMSAQIGIPNFSDFEMAGMDAIVSYEDPDLATALGLIVSGMEQSGQPSGSKSGSGLFRRLFGLFAP